ncbi:MAG: corrinoid protein [Chloroflexota bacterium]
MNTVLTELYDAVMNGDAGSTPELVQKALDQGIEPGAVLNQGMIAAMGKVGELFEEGEYFVPEMLISARAMQAGLSVLKPHLAGSSVQSAGRVVIGTVKGDLHDIGKNLVAMLMEGAGFEVVDLGADVPPEKFVAAIKTGSVDIIGLSALLTTTMPMMKQTIDALVAAGVREQIKIMIGGAPVTQGYADQIGADGYAPDASRAVAVAKSLLAR